MYNLLIVDDEPIIVDVIYDLLLSIDQYEMQLFRAYSAQEAIQLLQRVKMDVVVSDIQMPGMNGLELQKRVRQLWPRCKFIFITGYNDFDYIQEAVRNDVTDYIMKNEDDGHIVQAVIKALGYIERERSDEQLLAKAKQQYHLAIPKLREDYLRELLLSHRLTQRNLKERFDELGIRLDPDKPVYMLLGNVDQWPSSYSFSDRALMLYAIQNVAEEWIGSFGIVFAVTYDHNKLVWFIQSNQREADEPIETLVTAALDSIQLSSFQLLSVSLSFIFNPVPTDWLHITKSMEKLISKLYRSVGHEKRIILLESDDIRDHEMINRPLIISTNQLQHWETLLETGRRELFRREINPFIQQLAEWKHSRYDNNTLLQNYFALVSMLIAYTGRRGLSEEATFHTRMERLLAVADPGDPTKWRQQIPALLQLIDFLFEQQSDERMKETHAIIYRVNEYVESHLEGDLSLNTVAGLVYLSPSYFSRLYKQETGMKYSDYVIQHKIIAAKQYLNTPGIKIHEIAQRLGFESAAYFTSFFKKYTSVTPQEYRNKNVSNKTKEM